MRPTAAAVCAALAVSAAACDSRSALPGKPQGAPAPRPDQVVDFAVLYGSNCAGCHGPQGRGGPAIGLGDPVYLAIADDAFLSRVTGEGVPGTAMPAFARSAGGMLTDQQIDAIVRGLRARWAQPDVLRGANPPPHRAPGPAEARRGETVFAFYCAACHGAGGAGGQRASSIVDPSYLALVSDQNLRTNVIVGRPELGAPDWRGNVPGKPMSAEDVSDVVAWLSAHRVAFPGQPYPSTPADVRGKP